MGETKYVGWVGVEAVSLRLTPIDRLVIPYWILSVAREQVRIWYQSWWIISLGQSFLYLVSRFNLAMKYSLAKPDTYGLKMNKF